MANILLGVTGSVAAIHTVALFQELKQTGHAVKIVATSAALYFFDPAAIEPVGGGRNPDVVVLDADEWPRRPDGQRYERGEPVLHIELRRWADVLLIAPLDANTLAKLACGLCDNCLTCVWRAWDRARPIVLAPAMNTLMWENPLTRRHLRVLAEDAGSRTVPSTLELPQLMDWINAECPSLKVVPPIVKRLACEDVGVGAMAERGDILDWLSKMSQTASSDSTIRQSVL
jgi:phosphopantothenoylcysteine decarboxylase